MQSNEPSLEPPLSVPCNSPSLHEAEGERESKSEGEAGNLEEEEEDAVQFLDEGESQQGLSAKEEAHGWPELQEQIKADLKEAQKKETTLTKINQFMILRNFAMLWIKGLGHMAASEEIVWQWHESEGIHFTRWIWMLARHYQ
jgi:hypothetical protein